MSVYRNRTKYPNKAKKPIYAMVKDPPPLTEWDNPHLRRKTEDFGDSMRLRRARLKGAATSMPVVRRLIIIRDRSTCWICKRVLEEHEIHLDHVIPLSRGGAHDPENVKVACAACNMWKHDRIVQPI